MKDKVKTLALSVKEKLGEVVDALCADRTESTGASWADVAKLRSKKHLLVVKVSDQDKRAIEMKNVSRVL